MKINKKISGNESNPIEDKSVNEEQKTEKDSIDENKSKLNEIAENVEGLKAEKPLSKWKQKKKLEEQKQSETKEAFSKSISGVGSMLMGMVIERMPNPKPLSDRETEQINIAFDRIADKYAPLLGKYSEEVALVVACGIIVMPRLQKVKVEKSEPEEKVL